MHIQSLGQQGMGYKRTADAAGVATSVVQTVLCGRKTRIRARSHRKILAVTAQLAPGAYVAAGPTWVLLDRLIANGYPKVRIARWLGQKGPGLQLRRTQVTVKNAARVKRLYAWLMAEQRSVAS
jgi:hypothetical protein